MEDKWKACTGRQIKIAIIDSGIEQSHPQMMKHSFKGLEIIETENDFNIIENSFEDNMGHGTAVTHIIKSVAPDSSIFMIKLFQDTNYIEHDKLLYALEIVKNIIKPDILHLSNGVIECDSLQELKLVCHQLREQGTIIVSAFDNMGSVSYPAAFEGVIGVDWYKECTKVKDYIFIDDYQINILGYGLEQKLPWVNHTYKKVGGSSFAAPRITACIAQLMEAGYRSYEDIMEGLRNNALEIRQVKKGEEPKPGFNIRKAIVFPFNKEVQVIARFESMLNFSVMDYYEFKASRSIGEKIGDIINCDNDKILKNYKDINWNSDFDTVILGHVKEMSKYARIDFLNEFLDLCLRFRKNLFIFDQINDYEDRALQFKNENVNLYSPTFNKGNIPGNPRGKLRRFGKPVICIMGTSSKQGKFSLQLNIRRLLQEKGYKVGQLGTEPSSLLFGMNEILPMGYGTEQFEIRGEDIIHAVNMLIGRIEDESPDLILLGTQSHTIPYSMGNLMFYPVFVHDVLWGAEPDAVILCVNIEDDIDYIKKTIKYIESVVDTDVICLSISPIPMKELQTIFGVEKIEISSEACQQFKDKLSEICDINIFESAKEEDLIKIVETIENYFTEE